MKLKPEIQAYIDKFLKVAMYTTDMTIEYIRLIIKKIQNIDWRSYFHPSVYATEGIERVAAFSLDAFIAFCLILFPAIGYMLAILYLLLCDALPFLNGQSLGKHFFQLRVVSKNNMKPLTGFYKRAILRSGVLLVPGLNIYDVYKYITTGQRMADVWTQTVVIKERYNVQDNANGNRT